MERSGINIKTVQQILKIIKSARLPAYVQRKEYRVKITYLFIFIYLIFIEKYKEKSTEPVTARWILSFKLFYLYLFNYPATLARLCIFPNLRGI